MALLQAFLFAFCLLFVFLVFVMSFLCVCIEFALVISLSVRGMAYRELIDNFNRIGAGDPKFQLVRKGEK